MFNPPTDRAGIETLQRVGIDTVVAGSETLDALLEQPLTTYAVVHAFRTTEKDEDLAVNINGLPFQWFGSGCPSSPAVHANFYKEMERLLSLPIKGVFLDGVRFPSPASSEIKGGFFSCFCPRCQKDMTNRGYDKETIMRDVRKAADLILRGSSTTLQKWLRVLYSPTGWPTIQAAYPGVVEWLRYRVDCVTLFVRELAAWMDKYYPDKELAAFLFQPCLAYFVGQDYHGLSPYLKIISPMVYRNYPHQPGPATINQEIMAVATRLHDCTSLAFAICLQDLLRIFGLESDGALPLGSEGTLSISLDHMIGETLAATALSGSVDKVIPIIWAGDARLPEAIAQLAEAGIWRCLLFTHEAGLATHGHRFYEILANVLQ